MIISIIHSNTGLAHLVFACLALITGSFVLALRKGSKLHKQIGYAYVVMMLFTNVTAFGLYHLFGKFGPFHFAALLSLASVTMGFIPAIQRKPKTQWLERHIAWMYWSVIGLYAAFASEVVVRIPGVQFFAMVGLATFAVIFAGMWVYIKKYKNWRTSN